METISIIETADGSHTLEFPKYNASYHSIHGALEEAIHIFLQAGLEYHTDKETVRIFEMGFGSGLNAWLSFLIAHRRKQKVDYHGLEKHPLALDIINQLNYPTLFPVSEEEASVFKNLHSFSWDERHNLNNYFQFKKTKADILNYDFKENYDVIYFDAFAPNSQPKLWESSLHQKLYDHLNPGGTLVTYCAKGEFKRMLFSLGYKLEKLKGPNRKHEMTRAIKAG